VILPLLRRRSCTAVYWCSPVAGGAEHPAVVRKPAGRVVGTSSTTTAWTGQTPIRRARRSGHAVPAVPAVLGTHRGLCCATAGVIAVAARPAGWAFDIGGLRWTGFGPRGILILGRCALAGLWRGRSPVALALLQPFDVLSWATSNHPRLRPVRPIDRQQPDRCLVGGVATTLVAAARGAHGAPLAVQRSPGSRVASLAPQAIPG